MKPADDPHQLMRLAEVAALIAVKPRTIKSWVDQRKFPLPLAPTETLRLWRRRDVLAWMAKHHRLNQEQVVIDVSEAEEVR